MRATKKPMTATTSDIRISIWTTTIMAPRAAATTLTLGEKAQ